jgi:hypothetical protein
MTETRPRAFAVQMSDVRACPDLRLDPKHYRPDGSCYHHPTKAGSIDRAL